MHHPLRRAAIALALMLLLAAAGRTDEPPLVAPYPEGYGTDDARPNTLQELPAPPSAPRPLDLGELPAAPLAPPPAPAGPAYAPPIVGDDLIGGSGWSDPGDLCAEPDCAADCEPAGDVCCYPRPRWDVRAGALLLQRSRPDRQTLLTDSFLPGGTELLNAEDFGFDYRWGWSIAADRAMTDRWDLGLRFFSVESWHAQREGILAPGGAVIPFAMPVGNVFLPAEVSARYESELDSAEINATYHFGPRLRGLAGVRYLELGDGGLTILHDVGPGLNLATSQIEADNKLYGGQVGAEVLFWQGPWLTLDGAARLGLFSNTARSRVQIEQTAVDLEFGSAGRTTGTALLAELEFGAEYRLTQYLSLRGAYSLLWLDGVAEAAAQVPLSDPLAGVAEVNDDSSPFFHGAFFGITYRR